MIEKNKNIYDRVIIEMFIHFFCLHIIAKVLQHYIEFIVE